MKQTEALYKKLAAIFIKNNMESRYYNISGNLLLLKLARI